ncbi:hypothetical protein [Rugamonas rivuli]|uniref:Uncharacterized protein n=1 Tax=Rugamonas rivuli TaxID=2743358 RepID=A0A843S9E9_9BURK|nr:hypothetical protein [Rugamonas rivuli]MQA19492.1 hypothetical protein [Rugamonas rivuli]
MPVSNTALKQQRLDALFNECQQHVFSQVLGAFGLSRAMFADKAGGNVTTLHNFESKDGPTANANDQALKENFQKDFERKNFSASQKEWCELRKEKMQSGTDAYTGETLAGLEDPPHLDHVISLEEIAGNAAAHLALGKVGPDGVDLKAIINLANDEANLAITNAALNGSKNSHDLKEWMMKTGDDGRTNAERFGVDPERAEEIYNAAQTHVNGTVNSALLSKQAGELLSTGAKQAAGMALRQAMGLLLTELVNALFTELKALIRHGFEVGKSVFREIGERLQKVGASVAAKLPDALSALLDGGVSGFLSNLLTFVINSFITTGARLVRVIREGLIGLFKAFKMLVMPPVGMTRADSVRAGSKMLITVIVSSIGILLEQSVVTFVSSLGPLAVIADAVGAVLTGIIVGLSASLLAYLLDRLFDKYLDTSDESRLDQQLDNAAKLETMSAALAQQLEASIDNLRNGAASMAIYQDIGKVYGQAGQAANDTLSSMRLISDQTGIQIAASQSLVQQLESDHLEIEAFLKKL